MLSITKKSFLDGKPVVKELATLGKDDYFGEVGFMLPVCTSEKE